MVLPFAFLLPPKKPFLPTNRAQTPETNYLTLTLKALGFSTFNTNLLTIPSSVLFIIQLQFWTWVSERLNQRFLVGLISQLWAIPLLIALETLPVTFHGSNWARYAISSLIVGYPYVHAILGEFYCVSNLVLRTVEIRSIVQGV
jgi:hypothetical protein